MGRPKNPETELREAREQRAARVYEKYGMRASLYAKPSTPLFDETRAASEGRVLKKGKRSTQRQRGKRYWGNVKAKVKHHAETKYRYGKVKSGFTMETSIPLHELDQAPTTTLVCRPCGNTATIPALGGLSFLCSCGLRYQT